jgi:O-antigen/teichoic acid export membrane protein
MSPSQSSFAANFTWSGASQSARQVIQLLMTMILARLLAPDDFGLMGMSTVVVGFVALFKDLGTAAAVIQRKELSDKLLSSIFWLNITFGLVTTLAVFLLSPLIAHLYQEPRLINILRGLSFTFCLSGASILQQALLERRLEFRKLALAEIMASVMGGLTGVLLALMGAGVWSLVFQTLMMTAATSVLLWILTTWRPQLRFSRAEVKSISGYSLNLTGFNIFNYFARNADYFLIGRYLGAHMLGYYLLAYRVLLLPLQTVSYVVGRVTFPMYSRVQTDNVRLRYLYLRVVEAIALVTFPLMLGIWATADVFVQVVFGPQWLPTTAVLIVIFAPLGMLHSITVTVGGIYQAKGRTDLLFRWGIFSGSLAIASFVIGLRWNVIGVALTYALVSCAIAYLNFALPFRLVNLKIRDLLKALRVPLTYSLTMLIVVIGLRIVEGTLGIDEPAIILVSAASIGATVYGGLLLWRRPPILRQGIAMLPAQRLTWLKRWLVS